MPVKKTHEQFIAEIQLQHPTIEVLGHYEKANKGIECLCKVCGNVWFPKPNNLLHGNGCGPCGIKKRATTQRKTTAEFIAEMQKVNPMIRITSEYLGAQVYIEYICLECGEQRKALPTNLLAGKACMSCARKRAGQERKKTTEEFRTDIAKKLPYISVLGEYTDSFAPILVQCKKCGKIWTPKAENLALGIGCARCAGNEIYTPEAFVAKMAEVNPFIEILSDYYRAVVKVKCRCKRCSNEWEAKPNNLLNGRGCPECNHSSTSFIEQVILGSFRIVFSENTVKSRDRKAIGKELDIYIPHLGIAIEPGSWKWHEPKIDIDVDKRVRCKEKGIRLIFIYTDFPYKRAPFEEDCIITTRSLCYSKDQEIVFKIIEELFDCLNIDYQLNESEWDYIIQKAYDKSRKMTTSKFKERLFEINSDIEVLGEYTGASNPILCRCIKCGKEWEPLVNNLLKGHGCRSCSNMKNKKH